MAHSPLKVLRERGFLKQIVFEEELEQKFNQETVTFYIGFDPTADSLHIGGFIQLMAMAHIQRAGHKPIALAGGGTAMVGDPSFRNDMRKMLSHQEINHNVAAISAQMGRLISFEGENSARILNNADWLLKLNYVDFIRDVGVHFSVNKMLTAECFKQRLDKGLSFLEFNYMLMQGYDFLYLYENYGCTVQIGGNDQWSNCLAGADLIRRKHSQTAYVLTTPLLESESGEKMGKTQKGAIWLDANKTSPYEFYQYFRNIEDGKVEECLRLLTFLPLAQIQELTRYKDERMNAAKQTLAFEVTKLIHGEQAAQTAQTQALAAFGGDLENMPSACFELSSSTPIIDVLCQAQIVKTKSEARRLIDSRSIKVNETTLEGYTGTIADFINTEGYFIIHKGKKTHLRIEIK